MDLPRRERLEAPRRRGEVTRREDAIVYMVVFDD
jgi:hypothetical protein